MNPSEQQRLEQMTALYDADASTFASIMQDSTPYTRWYEDFLTLVPMGGKIADLGCGAGRDVNYFLEANYDAIGVDLSDGLLDQARNLGIDPARLFKHDLRELDTLFAPESMDGIRMFAVLVHMGKAVAKDILQKAWEILKSGGAMHVAVKLLKEGDFEEVIKESLSTPGKDKRYIYWKEEEMEETLSGLGATLISTSHDFHTDRDSRLHVLVTK